MALYLAKILIFEDEDIPVDMMRSDIVEALSDYYFDLRKISVKEIKKETSE